VEILLLGSVPCAKRATMEISFKAYQQIGANPALWWCSASFLVCSRGSRFIMLPSKCVLKG
ncbi:unnamed protein product, partial [Ilex paraguariensis]